MWKCEFVILTIAYNFMKKKDKFIKDLWNGQNKRFRFLDGKSGRIIYLMLCLFLNYGIFYIVTMIKTLPCSW